MMTLRPTKKKEAERERLAADLAAYLAKGGRIDDGRNYVPKDVMGGTYSSPEGRRRTFTLMHAQKGIDGTDVQAGGTGASSM